MSAALAETPGIPESSVSTIPGGKQNPSNRPSVRDLLPVPLRWLLKLVNASNTKRATAGSAKNVTVSLAANSPATTSSPSIWLPTSQLSLVAKSAVQTTQSVVSFACIQISSLFVVTNVRHDYVTLKYYMLEVGAETKVYSTLMFQRCVRSLLRVLSLAAGDAPTQENFLMSRLEEEFSNQSRCLQTSNFVRGPAPAPPLTQHQHESDSHMAVDNEQVTSEANRDSLLAQIRNEGTSVIGRNDAPRRRVTIDSSSMKLRPRATEDRARAKSQHERAFSASMLQSVKLKPARPLRRVSTGSENMQNSNNGGITQALHKALDEKFMRLRQCQDEDEHSDSDEDNSLFDDEEEVCGSLEGEFTETSCTNESLVNPPIQLMKQDSFTSNEKQSTNMNHSPRSCDEGEKEMKELCDEDDLSQTGGSSHSNNSSHCLTPASRPYRSRSSESKQEPKWPPQQLRRSPSKSMDLQPITNSHSSHLVKPPPRPPRRKQSLPL